jgi:Skp family chaperone for outer membrane proteins
MQKRQELLQPILTEVDSVIQVIGKEGKYTMIFDTSVSGALLFAEDGNDLTDTVQARLKK